MDKQEILQNISSLATLRNFKIEFKDNSVEFYRVEFKFFGFCTDVILICVVDYIEKNNTIVINFNDQTKSHEVTKIIEVVNSVGGIYDCNIKCP